jgi:hypothetical protein
MIEIPIPHRVVQGLQGPTPVASHEYEAEDNADYEDSY